MPHFDDMYQDRVVSSAGDGCRCPSIDKVCRNLFFKSIHSNWNPRWNIFPSKKKRNKLHLGSQVMLFKVMQPKTPQFIVPGKFFYWDPWSLTIPYELSDTFIKVFKKAGTGIGKDRKRYCSLGNMFILMQFILPIKVIGILIHFCKSSIIWPTSGK